MRSRPTRPSVGGMNNNHLLRIGAPPPSSACSFSSPRRCSSRDGSETRTRRFARSPESGRLDGPLACPHHGHPPDHRGAVDSDAHVLGRDRRRSGLASVCRSSPSQARSEWRRCWSVQAQRTSRTDGPLRLLGRTRRTSPPSKARGIRPWTSTSARCSCCRSISLTLAAAILARHACAGAGSAGPPRWGRPLALVGIVLELWSPVGTALDAMGNLSSSSCSSASASRCGDERPRLRPGSPMASKLYRRLPACDAAISAVCKRDPAVHKPPLR